MADDSGIIDERDRYYYLLGYYDGMTDFHWQDLNALYVTGKRDGIGDAQRMTHDEIDAKCEPLSEEIDKLATFLRKSGHFGGTS